MIAEAVTNFVFSSGSRCRNGRVFALLRADLSHAALTLFLSWPRSRSALATTSELLRRRIESAEGREA
jgi:hypothetical protein